MSHTPTKDHDANHRKESSHTPNKDRDGHHVKELGRDILNLFKRKKKKSDQAISPHPPPHSPIPQLPAPSSDNQRDSDPASFPIHHLPLTPPGHSEATQHSADARSVIHTAHSTTSLTEITSTGATSGESVDHENSLDDHKNEQKKKASEERRAHFRALGVHVVADEDDHTQFEESHCPFRVDRRLIDRLQWKDGIAPVDFGKPKKPRFVKRKENGEKLNIRSEMEIMKDAIPLEEISVRKKKEVEVKAEEGLSTKERRLKELIPVDGLSTKERRLKELIPLEDKTPRKKSGEKKKEELKDAIPLEEKRKSGELMDAIPLEEKKEKKRKEEKKKREKEEEREREKKREKEEDEMPLSRRARKSRKTGSEEEAIEDVSDHEKRKKKGEEDGIHLEDPSGERKKRNRDGEKKREEKGKEGKKEEKKKEEKRDGDEGKKKEAAKGRAEEKREEKKEGGREKQRTGDGKKKEEEEGGVKGERELREARRKDEEKIGDSNDKLAVVPYEEWPVPSLVEKVDQFIGYRVLTGGYKAAYFGYVCMHVSYSFFAHLANFDFNRSVPSTISKKLTPSTPSRQTKSGKKDDGQSPISSTARSTRSTPRSSHSSTKRIVIKKPVEYSNGSGPSLDSVDVAMCH